MRTASNVSTAKCLWSIVRLRPRMRRPTVRIATTTTLLCAVMHVPTSFELVKRTAIFTVNAEYYIFTRGCYKLINARCVR